MKKILNAFLIALMTITVINSCHKDDTDDFSIPGGGNPAQIHAVVSGVVVDEGSLPLAGVTVSAAGTTSTTDANGYFHFEADINSERCVLNFSKSGFLRRTHAFKPGPAGVNYIKVMLTAEPASQNLPAASGGTIQITGGASVQFQANSFVIKGTSTPYTGIVSVQGKLLAPDDPDFSLMIPGGDLAGKNISGDDVNLYSFGMMNVVLKGSGGEELQLAAGMPATLTCPVAPSQLGSAPATVPLWYFDEADAVWKEEGQAVKTGNYYSGTVNHFSWWNCDQVYDRATVSGRVVDCEGNPLSNITVTVNGQMTVTTDQDGNYSNWVPAGIALTFQVMPQGVFQLGSLMENIGALQLNQTATVPDLELPCAARITGHLTDCDDSPVSGSVMLVINNNSVSYIYTSDGDFTIQGFPNETYTLIAVSGTGTYSQTVTTPAAGASTDIGTLQLCSSMDGTNSFVINGGSYHNLHVNITGLTMSEAFYNSGQYRTDCDQAGGISALGSDTRYDISFPGNQPVVVDLAQVPHQTVGFLIHSSSGSFINKYHGSASFVLTVTQYGNVGDSIKGTFYGDMMGYSDSTSYYVTNGKFAFLRTPDQ